MNSEILFDDTGRELLKVKVAKRFHERASGLLCLPKLCAGEGLLIASCNSVHTFFMSYAIDVMFLSKNLEILSVIQHLVPWRMAANFGASMTLELPAGSADAFELKPGMQLRRTAL